MDTNQPGLSKRHYEIDALRVIALVLLIVYHIFVSYQPFANLLRFVKFEESLEEYWFIGDIINIWRIPVLFLVSGMAVGFVLERRTVRQVVEERLIRLVPPLVFASLFVVPFWSILYDWYYDKTPVYRPSSGHLWFVQNLVTYLLLVTPLVVLLKKFPGNWVVHGLRRSLPFGLLFIVPIPLIIETTLTRPESFAFFPFRFWYGFFCYLSGFILVVLGDRFWSGIRIVCHVALPLAILFYLGRIGKLDWSLIQPSEWAISLESGLWMLAFIGYGSLLLNRPSKTFSYLNQAVFPIYIVHMPIQQLVAVFIFRWGLGAEITFLLHVLLTLAICWMLYEWVIRRFRWIYPVMGLKGPARTGEASGDHEGKFATSLWGRRLTLYVLTPLLVIGQVATFVFMAAQEQKREEVEVPSDTLWRAAKNNDIGALNQFIVAGHPGIDQPDPVFKLTALSWAALAGSTEAVETLVEAGATLDVRSGDKSTPLGHAALMGRVEIVRFLVQGGAGLNGWNRFETTALDNTEADWSTIQYVARLVGVEVDRSEWEKGRAEAMRILVENGAKRREEMND